jgi:hypothetical protein
VYDWYERIFFHCHLSFFLHIEVQQSEDQLLAASDLIEFEWFKETKMEGIVFITIPLTRHFNLSDKANDDQQKRRRKAQSIKPL